ncbi:hypothetical protein [Acrocarpospora sp. B8E8]|uniref:hypothetical protein n=1 Tax=Acrocarpospora sp. B8E8 TaxID=3153572 RepID=UPI00325CAF97
MRCGPLVTPGDSMLRKLAVGLGAAAIALAGTVGAANAAPTKPSKPRVAYSAHGKVKQEAYWALSYNHAGVIVCVTKGDKSEAVYKIAKYAKANRAKGYYWGGPASAKYDRMCNAK